ncbi:hypothetical protein CDAR_587521 [Caerostris darwini]|uniref:Uncharacterized protein n=1 Tax=Caerostris darwini TaxID=1538125 RepID=A0AAV4SKS3_9ARAC|nr:hypothetical protein CDAR_587521 [Caerostris darwini]
MHLEAELGIRKQRWDLKMVWDSRDLSTRRERTLVVTWLSERNLFSFQGFPVRKEDWAWPIYTPFLLFAVMPLELYAFRSRDRNKETVVGFEDGMGFSRS